MARLELLDFQQAAADALVDAAVSYYAGTPDQLGGRVVPFVGQLKAVTGAGKTPVLTTTMGRLPHSIVLWTTKYGSVVDQTFRNLSAGGKYHHLFGAQSPEVIKFSEIPSFAAWQRILEHSTGLTILVSTVAAWNSVQKDERLNVHRVHQDWGERSRWDQLKAERRRMLWVVYDEAHNQTTDQVELLDDLNPAGFFVASASPIKGKLQYYLSLLTPEQRARRMVSISTRAVVEAQLLKSTIAVADYDSEPVEMIRDAAERRQQLEVQLAAAGSSTVPRAIYVVESSNTTKSAVSRPVAIWKALTEKCGVPADVIAVCTNTKNLPNAAIQVKGIGDLSDRFTHIIFNKKLQEGWDDPSVYVCYFDGETESATRIQQVIGRAMRQPEVRHFNDEDLNSAYFFVSCPNDALEEIIDGLKEELRIYKDDDAPDDFEPFQIKEERRSQPKVAVKPELSSLTVPRLQLELPSSDQLQRLLKRKTLDFSAEDRAAPGRALISIVSVRTGDVEQQKRDLLEDMRVPCGRYLQEQIRITSKSCLNSMEPALFSNAKLDKTACYRSKALEYYRELALDLVAEYENHVKLAVLADPIERDYVVGPFQPSGSVPKTFKHAGHPHYDTKAFNPDELAFAKALDEFVFPWVRNKDRLDYGIPLPAKSGGSATFYPDFLWWVNGTVWAIDPTGKHLMNEKIRSKLLTVPAPLKIALVTRGGLDASFRRIGDDGWAVVRLRMGNAAPEVFENLNDMLTVLVNETVGVVA